MSFPPECQDKPYEFTEWQTHALERHGEHLSQRMRETQIPRQKQAFDREIGHIAFELVSRRHDYATFYAALQEEQSLSELALSEGGSC